jgi:DNA-binding response OmpR family regulator
MIKGPILIVDDDPLLLEPIATALELAGYTTRTARGGEQALTMIQRNRPAVVLLDLHMPGLDGRGLVRELARRKINVPTVLMSANDDVGRAAADLQVEAYLSKPFAVQELLEVIAACGNGNSRHRSAA